MEVSDRARKGSAILYISWSWRDLKKVIKLTLWKFRGECTPDGEKSKYKCSEAEAYLMSLRRPLWKE